MRRVFVSIAVVIIAFYSALYLYGFFQLRRAGLLVKRVEKLRLGALLPKQPFGTGLRDPYCMSDRRCYLWVSNLPFAEFWRMRGIRPTGVMPSNWWHVIAQVGFDSSGNVVDKELAIDDGKYHQFGTVEVTVSERAILYHPCVNPIAAMHPGYWPRQEMRTGALLIDVSPNAEQSLIDRSFDLQLDCLNTIKGCKTPGDIAPKAWGDIWESRRVNFDSSKCRLK
jgi:hypothetical protein